MPSDDFANYKPRTSKVSYSTARISKYQESEGTRALEAIKTSADMENSIRRSEMDTYIERREMRRRTRSKTKKRSNRLELRRKRSARRNRSEINFIDRRENRRAGQTNNRHATLSPTRKLKEANSSKSPGTTDRETDEKEQKQNIFTRPPSAFGNAPPGSSAPTTFKPGLVTLLCSTMFLLFMVT